ncbi:MAG TPA: MaoC family dehydratase [Pirellulales bacterium]|nr:MaoC family dehydratase [Pirellulales bacterium]
MSNHCNQLGKSFMAVRVIQGLEELRTLVGQPLGASEWIEITQQRVQAFADGTDDHQWIHCDPERAKKESPYGTTVAHGFLTLSLCNSLVRQIFRIEGIKMVLNYGLNRVRFPTAVKVGSRVRMSSELIDLKETRGSVQATFKQTFEIEGEARPACVAETVVRIFF